MRNINVDIQKCNSLISEIESIKTSLDNCASDLKKENLELLKVKSIYTPIISNKIINAHSKMLDEAAKASSLSKALSEVMQSYNDCERFILNSGQEMKQVSFVDSPSEMFAFWLGQRIKKFLGWKETDEDRKNERENDLYMQKAIFEELNNEKYSKETWEKASLEERKAIIKAFMIDIAVIYGVIINTNVGFFNENSGTRGYYDSSSNRVFINEKTLNNKDSYKVFQTMIHEMRHAYQAASVKDPNSYVVSEETIEQWKNNFEDYKSVDNGYSYEEYVSQPIEYDAKNFAKQYSDLDNADPEYRGSW